MNATRVLVNADVQTIDDAGARANAIAFRDGRILAVGEREAVARAAGDDAESWDVGGATVLPGFVDPHQHPFIVALYGVLPRLEPPHVTDIPTLQRVLAEAARELPKDRWLVATQWNEEVLRERRAPTRRELDDAVPEHPLFALHYSCHRGVANSRALEAAQIDRSTPDPSGGRISRARDGVPDGLLIERGMSRVERLARASLAKFDGTGFMERLGDHHRALVAAGITRIVDAAVPGDLRVLYREADRRGLLRVPTTMMRVSTTGYFETPWDVLDGVVEEAALEDTELLRTGPVKLVFDGAPVCSMCLGWWQVAGATVTSWAMAIRRGSLAPIRAAMSAEPRIGRVIRTGVAIYSRAEANEIVLAAVDRGLAVAVHALGNDAVDVAVTAYEAAGSALARGGLPRIEHAAFLDRKLVARLANLGAAVVTQPTFLTLPTFDSAPPIPGLRNMPLRWLLDAKIKVAGSSDHPVVSFDPLEGIRAAVSRHTRSGRPHEPDQKVTLDEALVMFTRSAAEAAGCLDECGTLSVGKRADLVILNDALTTSTLPGARVRSTVLGGEVVFGAPPA